MYNIAVSYIERRLTMHPLKEAMIMTLWHTQQSESSGKIKICRSYLEIVNDQQQQTVKNISWQNLFLKLTGIDLSVCPVCGNGKMKTQKIINPIGKASLKSLILLNRFVCFLTYHGNLAIESP